MTPIASLIAANFAFLAVHFILSHPLRAPLVRMAGEPAFLGLYSLVSLLAFGWIVVAFRAAGPGGPVMWDGQGDAAWIVASALTIVAMALLIGSLRGNPALPQTKAGAIAGAQAAGVFAVTRHPMMWSIALWAAAHVLVMPNARTTFTALFMGWLALAGAHLQDTKKRALLGQPWRDWELRTAFWPRLTCLGRIGPGVWIAALIGWLGLTWVHQWLAGIPAGAWRWLG